MVSNKKKIIILGAASFIARHAIKELLKNKNYDLSLGFHNTKLQEWDEYSITNIQKISLFDSASLNRLITEDSVVINFIYLNSKSAEENIQAIKNLLEACKEKKASRLIHCSTAVVNGRSEGAVVTEATLPKPFSEYEKIKLRIEQEIIKFSTENNFKSFIVRPTCVFGEHGKNLNSLIESIYAGRFFTNYLKSCLYNERKLNLVRVGKVVSAIIYMIHCQSNSPVEICIVSDDTHPINNYQFVKDLVISSYNLPRPKFPTVKVPNFIFYILMKILSKSNLYKNRVYLGNRLQELGWSYQEDFENDLINYLNWFRATHINLEERNR